MKLKLVPLYVTLALGGSLVIGCASQDGSDNKPQKTETQLTEQTLPVEQLIEAHSHSQQPVEEAIPAVPPSTEIAGNEMLDMPEESVFYFGFNKAEVDTKYSEVLKEHAEYLQANAGMAVQIEGHTDFHGPRYFNEALSKKRAEAIAKVLIDNGVPESQLVISSLADSKPMECKGDTRHNRRVELHYRESSLASNQ